MAPARHLLHTAHNQSKQNNTIKRPTWRVHQGDESQDGRRRRGGGGGDGALWVAKKWLFDGAIKMGGGSIGIRRAGIRRRRRQKRKRGLGRRMFCGAGVWMMMMVVMIVMVVVVPGGTLLLLACA